MVSSLTSRLLAGRSDSPSRRSSKDNRSPQHKRTAAGLIKTKSGVSEEGKKTADAAIASLDKDLETTGQSSLKVAAVLPLIMAVAFILMLIYYKSIGGYKPVILGATGQDKKDDEDSEA